MTPSFTPLVPGSIGFLQRLEVLPSILPPPPYNPVPFTAPTFGLLGLLESLEPITSIVYQPPTIAGPAPPPITFGLLGLLESLEPTISIVGQPPPTVTNPPLQGGILPLFGSLSLYSLIGGQLSGTPGSGNNPPPPPPPGPPPGPPAPYKLPLLNRLTGPTGIDPRLERIGNNLSALWNSLVRQGILVQNNVEEYNLLIRTLLYTPGNNANWGSNPPANVGQALDRIAAYLAKLGGGPIT